MPTMSIEMLLRAVADPRASHRPMPLPCHRLHRVQAGEPQQRDRLELARELYLAFAAGDRAAVERLLGDDFAFSSPVDPALDRAGYFERCWPGAGQGQSFEFLRRLASGDEVIVTYEMRTPDGRRGRNTEILTFRGDTICRAEVYFGWEVE
jgi:ketosteroid isomerase-like protein